MLQQVKDIIKKIPGTHRVYRYLKNIDLTLPASAKNIEQIKAEFIRDAAKELELFINSGSQMVFPECNPYKISVIIPVFNKDYFTYRCLKNLQNFTASSLEIIVVNNNSTDKTALLLERVRGIRVINNPENLHFLRASNQGAAAATAEYLLFLNNDAEPQADAMNEALKMFSDYEKTGAVGAKIILPDGRLQEAGSLIWNDGCCHGYGRGENPDSGKYNFIREVDYCSGAFLMTPRELFNRFGRFDERYSPAYYEESDYCSTLLQNGYRVIYNPEITVRHFEFGSSALSEQAFNLMRANCVKYTEKQAGFLKTKYQKDPINLFKASNLRQYSKKILYLDERLPQIKTGAGYPRANSIVKMLSDAGNYVTVYPLVYVDPRESWSNIRADIPAQIETCVFDRFGTEGFRSFYGERRDFYDTVWISRPTTMSELRKISPDLSIFAGKKIIYDAEALFTVREIAEKRLRGETVTPDQEEGLIKEEISIADNCTAIVCVSEREGNYYRKNGFDEVAVLGHCHEAVSCMKPFAETKDLLFVGAIHADFTPNADSIVWFAANVLPLITAKIPGIKLNVVGINKSSQVKALAGSGVNVIGPVDDLLEWFGKSRIFIAPTRFAAGIPHKITEAASHGIPCVVSRLIAEQLLWEDGRDYLSADAPEEYARAICELYTNEELWNKVSSSCLQRIAKYYSMEAFKDKLEGII